ncbi:MAG TPA: hypothetical protein VJ881_03390 [Halanaerobiales bacterium]|nr:hypothetical protein [Halanaerobiales bacterium]
MEDFFKTLEKQLELNLLADVLKDNIDLSNTKKVLNWLKLCSNIASMPNLKLIDLENSRKQFNKRIKNSVYWIRVFEDGEDVKDLITERKKRNPEFAYLGSLIKLEHEFKTK